MDEAIEVHAVAQALDGLTLRVLNRPGDRTRAREFVRRHHYLHGSAAVSTRAYGLAKEPGWLCGVAIYGPPPTPAITRAIVRDRDPALARGVLYLQRLVARGITRAQLDALLADAAADVQRHSSYWALYRLSDTTAHGINGLAARALARLQWPGFSGGVYARSDLGRTPAREADKVTSYVVDGQPRQCRQGSVTLTSGNVHRLYPDAVSIRAIGSSPKSRWVFLLGTPSEQADRRRLLSCRPQPWAAVVQPRLPGLIRLHCPGTWDAGPADSTIRGPASPLVATPA